MMATRLIADLARQNVLLWRDGDGLRVRAPKGVLTSELQSTLLACKDEILAALRDDKDAEQPNVLPRIVPDPVSGNDPFPLTDIQQAYLIGRGNSFALGNVACHAYYEVDARKIDLSRFSSALQRLIARHGMLRAVVHPDGRQQILSDVPTYEIKEQDLRGKPPDEIKAVLEAVRTEMSHGVAAGNRWPLFDIRATRLDDIRTRLHFGFDMLIADAWSLQILFREWARLYADQNISLPPLELSFRDYVMAEAELQNSDAVRRSQEYWASRLPTLPAAPELPLAVRPEFITNTRFTRRTNRIEPETWSAIKRRAANYGLTPSAVLLTVFAEILARWSKSPKFTINLTLLNRLPLHPQVNDVIGDFTTILPLAIDNSLAQGFESRAIALHSRLLEDLEHRFFSGVQVLRGMMRAQGTAPGTAMPVVFTSLLSPQFADGGPDQTLWMGDLVYGISQTPQVWLDHQVLEEGGALVFNWDGVEDLFPNGLFDDMFDSYCRLLLNLADGHRDWAAPVPELLPPHQFDLQTAANSTTADTRPCLLHTLFEEQAARRPKQQAIVAANGSLTYEELHSRASALAYKLRRMGARPNSLVAIVMEKGWEQIAGVLGVLMSGAAYLPVDPDIPSQRRQYLFEHGEVSLVLTQSWIDKRLEWPEEIERISVDAEPVASSTCYPFESAQQLDDLAYVIYTSGSTGQPKGVMISHKAVVNTILDINSRFDVKPSDRALAISSLSFDLSVYDIFGTLAAGGTIVMPDPQALRDPASWARLIESEGVTIWNSVPALMSMLVAYSSCQCERLGKSLRLVLLSGDWIPVTLPDKIKALADSAHVVSLGGATEAAIWSIIHPINDVSPGSTSIPYGRPMANQRFYIFNEALEACPAWVPGNLYIGGSGLSLGYWRDPERTRASFFSHPQTNERLYRTGDMGRYLPDGNIEFLGREDFQVKIQGYRIELGEIEMALATHPDVREAAALAVGPRDNRRLVAYIAPEQAASLSADALRDFLSQKLPGYMLPSRFVFVANLPLTANGKVDRTLLPDSEPQQSAACESHAVETSSVKERFLACIKSVLKLDRIEMDKSLFQLGANSIDIIHITGLIEKEMNVRPKVGDVYASHTIESLLKRFEKITPWEEGEL